MITTVINVRSGMHYDVYIGRPSKWGNPFTIGPSGNRRRVISRYLEYLRYNPNLIKQAKEELKGKVLGCWCKPQACHGDILADIANGRYNDANTKRVPTL